MENGICDDLQCSEEIKSSKRILDEEITTKYLNAELALLEQKVCLCLYNEHSYLNKQFVKFNVHKRSYICQVNQDLFWRSIEGSDVSMLKVCLFYQHQISINEADDNSVIISTHLLKL